MSFTDVLGEMAPYLLFGFLAAGVLSVILPAEMIERHLGGRGFVPVLKASAVGVPLPLCSCSVIPVATSLRRHGAGNGATTAFLISTPQTGIDSILATFSLLGPVFAVFRPLAALVTGLVGGIAASFSDSKSSAETESGTESSCCKHSCCEGKNKSGVFARILKYGFVTLPGDIAPSLLAGLVICALVSSLIPDSWFSDVVAPGPLQIAVLMLAGIPVYICATASIPVAAGLIAAGVSPGAAFALLMTGPATNAATLSVVWRVMGRYTCMVYLLTMMCGAFFGGMLLDMLVTGAEVRTAMHAMWMPRWLKTLSSVILVLILFAGVISVIRKKRKGSLPE